MSDDIKTTATITYGDQEITGLNLGETATLKTANLTLANDLKVKLFGIEGIWVGESNGSLEFNDTGNVASGEKSNAFGYNTIATGYAQHVQGKFNEADDSMVHIIGWGNDEDNRKNIHTIDTNGNAYFAGRLSLVEGVGYGTEEQLNAIEPQELREGQIFFIIE